MKKSLFPVIALMAFLMLTGSFARAQAYKTKFTVAKDGTGDYTSIQAAVDGCKSFPDENITIYIKNGVYIEKVVIGSWNTHLSLIGESKDSTIITYGDFFNKLKRGVNSTFLTATVSVQANDFEARNITFENSAGPVGQALALSVTGTRCLFENCRILGNQDTLYAAGEGAYQYYKNCYIEGTVDFIFGEATAVFESCVIKAKSNNYITAASTSKYSKYGYVFLNCTIQAAPGITKVFLGRPWRQYARVVYINCEMGSFITPEGWTKWAGPAEPLAYYAEFNSRGEGASPLTRVKWSRQLSPADAKMYTLKAVFSGVPAWPVK